MRFVHLVAGTGLLLGLSGCDQQSASPTSLSAGDLPATVSAASTPRATPVAAHIGTSPASWPDTNRPESAVEAFLVALRDGDDELATLMLTELAREESARRDLAVRPQGSGTATFEVGAVEYVTSQGDGAHVQSRWSDVDPQGIPFEHEITWVVRLEAPGWRIAGLATRLFPDEPPTFLNFEDPDDVEQKKQRATAQMDLRAQHLSATEQPATFQAQHQEVLPAPEHSTEAAPAETIRQARQPHSPAAGTLPR